MKLPTFKFKMPGLGPVSGLFKRFAKKKAEAEEPSEEDFLPSSALAEREAEREAEPDLSAEDMVEAALSEGGKDAPESDEGGDVAIDLDDIPDFDDDEDEDDRPKFDRKRLIFLGVGGAGLLVVLVAAWVLLSGDDPAENMASGASQGEAVLDLRTLREAMPEAPEAVAPETMDAETAMDQEPDSEASALEGGTGIDPTQTQISGLVVPAVTKASYAALPDAPKAAALSPAPDMALVEDGEVGSLPRIAEDGRTPLQVYARPPGAVAGDKPRIAIIVSGLGLSRSATEATIAKLPAEVTLALDVYARGLNFWVGKGRDAGHEILLTIPFESEAFPYVDAGPDALRSLSTPEQNQQRLEWLLSRSTGGYFGVMGAEGSKFTAGEDQVLPIMKLLKSRGLMFIDGGDAPGSKAPHAAFKAEAAWAMVDIVLDANLDPAAIDRQFAELERLAERRSLVVARMSPYPVSLERFLAWAATLESKGLQLVPVSSLANQQLIR